MFAMVCCASNSFKYFLDKGQDYAVIYYTFKLSKFRNEIYALSSSDM